MRKLILIVLLAMSAISVYADDLAKYREFADTIRKDVYSMEIPSFNVKEIPTKYSGESAVIKAVYENVEAKKKTGVGVGVGMLGLPMVSRRARVEFGYLTRMLIHVNDKAAIEKYSEFDFGIDRKKKYFEGYEKNRHAMGIRLIKPDGRIVDIDTSEFVEVEEGKKGEHKSRKIAIPGLEIGDDIDVFFYTDSKLQNVNPDPLTFYLKDEAPILNYQIHCVIDDNLSTQYRTLNGAPDFNISRDDDGNYVLDIELSDIETKEPRLWYNPRQQSPAIQMFIFNRRNSSDFTPKSARKDGLQSNPSCVDIIEDRWDEDDWWPGKGTKIQGATIKDEIRDGGKILKELAKMVKSGAVSDVQAADYLYNLLVYDYYGMRDGVDGYSFMKLYFDLLNTCRIPASLGLSSTDYQVPLDCAINLKDNIYFVKLNGNESRYYFPPVMNMAVIAPSEIDPAVQGRKSVMWRKKNERKKNPDVGFFDIPMSDIDANRNVTTVNASIDGVNVAVKRHEAYRGATKVYPMGLLTLEDIDKGYTSWLNRYGFSPVVKEKKKQTADREAAYDEQRKIQLDDFRLDVEMYHGGSPASSVEGKVLDIGIDPESPDLRYEVSYTMDNYVKRAGKNLILSVGKLLNSQSDLLPDDRSRADDVYFGTPLEYTTVINLELPSGFRVNDKSLSALERSVANSTGEFSVKASSPSMSEIRIEITKRYAEPRIEASRWPDFLKIIDAASEWNSASLVLEKQ